jgi:hypothetical protein
LLDVEVRGFEMGDDAGCAVIYLNMHYTGKRCSQNFQVTPCPRQDMPGVKLAASCEL